MEHFLLSYHSVGAFCGSLLSLIMTVFLITKRDKTTPTRWLGLAYVGFTCMFVGYFLAYSVFAPFGAYHRWLTVGVLFGQFAYLAFAYHFPDNDRPGESRIVIPIFTVASVLGWFSFAYQTYGAEYFYNFESHSYNFDAGQLVAGLILLEFLWTLSIFIRKSLRNSEYQGRLGELLKRPPSLLSARVVPFLLARFVSIPLVVFFPRGKKAQASSGFALGLMLLILTAAMNAANKAGRLSYEYYAMLFAVLSLIGFFVIFMMYLNNSPEPTTFMVKLIGISLVTLLLVFTAVGYISLAQNETSYDREKLGKVINSRKSIIEGDFANIASDIIYILQTPEEPGLFREDRAILFSRGARLTPEKLLAGERVEKRRRMEHDIQAAMKADKNLTLVPAREQVLRAHGQIVRPVETRGYRDAGEFYTHFDFIHAGRRYEVGFTYREYREQTHEVAMELMAVIIAATLVILLVFPLFFRTSLVTPLTNLLSGVKEVNAGDLDVVVPIKSQDEIGYLAGSFNAMVASIKDARQKLQDYADNLEEKVEQRTKEVREKMEEIHKLKVQQDGDYFLTSLLAQPLFYNANKSERVSSDFIINQKKSFEFRNRVGQLGGDICVTGNLKFGTPDNFRRVTMCMNGDAMGKSMQGAGGSLVMGVVMNSIMARSAANKRIMDTTPEQWLSDIYHEIHGVFKSFDGTMVISASVFLVDDLTGQVWYFNAEHPASVLYRNGRASFIEEDLQLRKLGLDSEMDFQVFSFQMEPGDVIILGSDGRDDINLTPQADTRQINEDEFLFLKIVEDADGDIHRIEKMIRLKGEITDDLSLLRIGYCEPGRPGVIEIDRVDDRADVDEMVERGRELYRKGELKAALSVLTEAYAIDRANVKLNKLLGLLSFKGRDYGTAVEVLNKYLAMDPHTPQFWMYLAIAEKKQGRYDEALKASQRLFEMDPENMNNLINMADLWRLKGDPNKAREYLDRAGAVDPDNREYKRLQTLIA